jgi:hypothetical protein
MISSDDSNTTCYCDGSFVHKNFKISLFINGAVSQLMDFTIWEFAADVHTFNIKEHSAGGHVSVVEAFVGLESGAVFKCNAQFSLVDYQFKKKWDFCILRASSSIRIIKTNENCTVVTSSDSDCFMIVESKTNVYAVKIMMTSHESESCLMFRSKRIPVSVSFVLPKVPAEETDRETSEDLTVAAWFGSDVCHKLYYDGCKKDYCQSSFQSRACPRMLVLIGCEDGTLWYLPSPTLTVAELQVLALVDASGCLSANASEESANESGSEEVYQNPACILNELALHAIRWSQEFAAPIVSVSFAPQSVVPTAARADVEQFPVLCMVERDGHVTLFGVDGGPCSRDAIFQEHESSGGYGGQRWMMTSHLPEGANPGTLQLYRCSGSSGGEAISLFLYLRQSAFGCSLHAWVLPRRKLATESDALAGSDRVRRVWVSEDTSCSNYQLTSEDSLGVVAFQLLYQSCASDSGDIAQKRRNCILLLKVHSGLSGEADTLVGLPLPASAAQEPIPLAPLISTVSVDKFADQVLSTIYVLRGVCGFRNGAKPVSPLVRHLPSKHATSRMELVLHGEDDCTESNAVDSLGQRVCVAEAQLADSLRSLLAAECEGLRLASLIAELRSFSSIKDSFFVKPFSAIESATNASWYLVYSFRPERSFQSTTEVDMEDEGEAEPCHGVLDLVLRAHTLQAMRSLQDRCVLVSFSAAVPTGEVGGDRQLQRQHCFKVQFRPIDAQYKLKRTDAASNQLFDFKFSIPVALHSMVNMRLGLDLVVENPFSVSRTTANELLPSEPDTVLSLVDHFLSAADVLFQMRVTSRETQTLLQCAEHDSGEIRKEGSKSCKPVSTPPFCVVHHPMSIATSSTLAATVNDAARVESWQRALEEVYPCSDASLLPMSVDVPENKFMHDNMANGFEAGIPRLEAAFMHDIAASSQSFYKRKNQVTGNSKREPRRRPRPIACDPHTIGNGRADISSQVTNLYFSANYCSVVPQPVASKPGEKEPFPLALSYGQPSDATGVFPQSPPSTPEKEGAAVELRSSSVMVLAEISADLHRENLQQILEAQREIPQVSAQEPKFCSVSEVEQLPMDSQQVACIQFVSYSFFLLVTL